MPNAKRSPKGKSRRIGELDRLSSLPGEVAEKILLLLPTREAVRTSVLSTKWKYKWAVLPCLVFDEECISIAANYARIIDQVLLVHIGPLRKVVFAHQNLEGSTDDIDRWILHLSRLSIREFILNFTPRPPRFRYYQLPSSFFSFRDMISLELKGCLIKPPSRFMGYPSLNSLTLNDVTLSQEDVVERLIVGCPLLKFLDIAYLGDFTCLKVNAPKLEVFNFNGFFENLCLEHTLNLKDVSIDLEEIKIRREASNSSSNLVKFFDQVPRIQILHLHDFFLKYLAFGSNPPVLPQQCLYLHTLDVHMDFRDQSQILSALCILRNSPILSDLRILTYNDVVGQVHPWFHDDKIFIFPELRNVRFDEFYGIQSELDFIRFLLLKSPLLEKMTIFPTRLKSRRNSSTILMKLLQFKRASADAEIIYSEKQFVNEAQ